MTHRITVSMGGGRFMIGGTKKESQEIAAGIAKGFACGPGAWLTHGDRTMWIPATSQIKIDLPGSELPELDATRVGIMKNCVAPMH